MTGLGLSRDSRPTCHSMLTTSNRGLDQSKRPSIIARRTSSGLNTGSQVNRDTVRTWMNCMIMLGEANHLQRSSQDTQARILDTIKALRNSLTLSSGSKTESESVPTSNALSMSASQGPGRVTGASMTQTTEGQGTSSLAKRQGKCSSMATTDKRSCGSTSSGEPPYHFHYFSDLLINGTTELKPKEAQSLSLVCGRCLSPLQHIQIIGGDNVLSIWKTPGNCGEDSLESITYQKFQGTTAIPLSSSIQRPSMINSLVRMKQRQPQSRSKSKPKDNEQKPWS